MARVLLDLRARELATKISAQSGVGVAELHRTHAAIRRRDEQSAEWRGRDRIANHHAGAVAAGDARGHAELLGGGFIQPAARSQAGIVESGRHVVSLLESNLQAS